MKHAIAYIGENNDGYPIIYPNQHLDLQDNESCPDGFIEMSEEEYQAYLTQVRTEYAAAQPIISLIKSKKDFKEIVKNQITRLVENNFSVQQQMTLTNLMNLAQVSGLQNRYNYIAQAWLWIQNCLSRYYVIRAQVEAKQSAEEVWAIEIDFSDLLQTIPSVNIETAMQIMD